MPYMDKGFQEHPVRSKISLAAAIIVGIIFLISGSGKLIGVGELPSHAMQFLGSVLPDFLFIPPVMNFVGNILIPYIIPAAEFLFGALLVLGFWPRIVALVCLVLPITFIANNSWFIANGMNFPSCECFGFWEEVFGRLTPLQSLYMDIGIVVLLVTIILVCPGRFISSRPWVNRLKQVDTEPGEQESE